MIHVYCNTFTRTVLDVLLNVSNKSKANLASGTYESFIESLQMTTKVDLYNETTNYAIIFIN